MTAPAQPTPGPWTVYDMPNCHVGNFPCRVVHAPYKNNTLRAVAYCVASKRDADARLIAAAPDLLAFVERAAEMPDSPTAWATLRAQATALLAEIRGAR